jgi:hypothetical protein
VGLQGVRWSLERLVWVICSNSWSLEEFWYHLFGYGFQEGIVYGGQEVPRAGAFHVAVPNPPSFTIII